MKIISLSIGSWYPKTSMHLKEFEDFLRAKQCPPQLDVKQGAELFALLDPIDVVSGDDASGLRFVEGVSHSVRFSYYADGLLVLKIEPEESVFNPEPLIACYEKRIAPTLQYLFSRGARGLEIVRSHDPQNRLVFIHTENADQKDIETFLASYGEVAESTHHFKSSTAYESASFMVVNFEKGISPEHAERIISHLILFREVKKHTTRLLETHRFIWDDTERLVSQSQMRVKDLPRISEQLTLYSSLVDNVSARIDQMRLNFEYRKSKARTDELIFAKLWPSFENVELMLDYVKNLFVMTGAHLKNTQAHTSTIYQDTQETALNRLQLLFLLSAVASLIGLGGYIPQDSTIPHTVVSNFIGFDLRLLALFGGVAVVITLIVYYFWSLTYRNVRANLQRK